MVTRIVNNMTNATESKRIPPQRPAPTGTTAFSVRELIALLEHQRSLYRGLRRLADRQKALVVQDDPQPLLGLLAERQKLVDELVSLNVRLGSYRESWPEVYSTLDEPARKQVADLLEEANQSLGSILKSDGEDTATLTARRADMSGRLAAVDAGGRASAAYAMAGVGMSSRLTDAEA
jgi:hypothetical protein